MTFKDIFIEDTDKKGVTVKRTCFIPNATDEELKKTLTEVEQNIRNKVIGLSGITQAEFVENRNTITRGLNKDAKNVKVISDELMSMRELARQIQEERDFLLDYIIRDVLGLQLDDKEN